MARTSHVGNPDDGIEQAPERQRPGMEQPTLDPTQAEIEEWAERERSRRELWLHGPTEEERAAFARRERRRRLARLSEEELDAADVAREMLRYPREAQLAAEGALSLLWKWYRRRLADMVQAGREWEDEFLRPTRRSRVPLDDDDS